MILHSMDAAFVVSDEYLVELLGDSIAYITTIMAMCYKCEDIDDVKYLLKTKKFYGEPIQYKLFKLSSLEEK